MGKFQRSWMLFRTSLSVIFNHKQLIVFPIVISALMVVIVLFFMAPVALMPTGHSVLTVEHWQAVGHALFVENGINDSGRPAVRLSSGAMVYLVFLYMVSMFVATFFNVAFYHEILEALQGDDVSLVRGLQFAVTRLVPIFMWSLLAGVVGLIIKNMEQRFGLLGKLMVRLIGVAWSIASVFAIPIIVQDDEAVNPLSTLKKSAEILKRTWGEALIGYVGLSFATGIIVMASVVVLVAAIFASIAINNLWLMGISIVVWFIGLLAFIYMSNLAGQVYKGALYLYAADGTIAIPYDQEMLDGAWKYKSRS